MRGGAAVSVATGVAGVEQAWAGAWKYFGLLVGGHPAGNTHALVLKVFERSLDVISKAIG